jgi:hypothetical protein
VEVALVFAKAKGTPTLFSITAGIKAPSSAAENPLAIATAAIRGASCLLIMGLSMAEYTVLPMLPSALRNVPMRPADTLSSSCGTNRLDIRT